MFGIVWNQVPKVANYRDCWTAHLSQVTDRRICLFIYFFFKLNFSVTLETFGRESSENKFLFNSRETKDKSQIVWKVFVARFLKRRVDVKWRSRISHVSCRFPEKEHFPFRRFNGTEKEVTGWTDGASRTFCKSLRERKRTSFNASKCSFFTLLFF